ncbi:MAG: tyrosine-type recombinase/integrase [Gemmatimonadales bacterium]
MSIYRRPESSRYVVEIRWQGLPRMKVSTGTSSKTRAGAMERTLQALRDAGRFDVLRLLADGKLRLADVHEDYQRDPAALQQRIAKVASPALGPLVDEWLAWLESPAALSSRTRRLFSPRTAYRYRESWQRLFRVLPKGRESALADITKGFIATFRDARRREGKAGSTINRDLCALSAFRRWCADERDLVVPALQLGREREPAGRERWLSAEELADLEQTSPREWWPLFAKLAFTGLRIGEAQGLRGADVRLSERRIRVHEGDRRLKNASSVRDVPIPEPLAMVLAEHLTRYPCGPDDLVFAEPYNDYRWARRVFTRATRAADLRTVTIHDLRHTFAVHAAQAGVPIPRIQKLLGHSTVAMAMRYMKRAPEAFFSRGCGEGGGESVGRARSGGGGAGGASKDAGHTTVIASNQEVLGAACPQGATLGGHCPSNFRVLAA